MASNLQFNPPKASMKRKHSSPPPSPRTSPVATVTASGGLVAGPLDEMEITMLGAGQEVGRSCCVIKYKERTIVCDAGVHPAYAGIGSLPFIDEIDWSSVDALLVTHFHVDHAASLTYVMEKTNFRDGPGKVYMTHPTKAVYRFVMQDFVRVSPNSTDLLFTESELQSSFNSIHGIDFSQEILIPNRGIRFTAYHAGHVLGAAMFLIEIAGKRILYTGDYSTEEDRHLVPARWTGRPGEVDVMICESTYGTQSVQPRLEKEQRFTTLISQILKRGGKVLMPVFALGRAQELFLVLDEYWTSHPELQHIPIYIISSLASKSLKVYQKFIHTMTPSIRARFARGENPFAFERNRFVRLLKNTERIDENRPCVVIASPGMLQDGVSRELLEKWAPDKKNGLVMTGYSVAGTLAHQILNEPDEITGLKGQRIPRRLSIEYISFSAHVDYSQNAKFIDEVLPTHLVLVHGELNTMNRLKAALKDKYAERKDDIHIHSPKNVEPLKLNFANDERIAKAIGTLASNTVPEVGKTFSGLLVQKDFSYTLIDPKDLKEFTGLTTTTILQRQTLNLGVGWELVKWHLRGMYGRVDEGIDDAGLPTMRIMQTVDLKSHPNDILSIQWVGSSLNDMIADSVMALLLRIPESPASIKLTSHRHAHAEPDSPPPTATEKEQSAIFSQTLSSRLDRLIAFLSAHFSSVEIFIPGQETEEQEQEEMGEDTKVEEGEEKEKFVDHVPGEKANGKELVKRSEEQGTIPKIRVWLDNHKADISIEDFTVESSYQPLAARVRSVVDIAIKIISPLDTSHSSFGRNKGDIHKSKMVKLTTDGDEEMDVNEDGVAEV
ncbi:Metallo-hydrolase/oxidoreductase [Atractiella rhizophila]|nr:Metallo-hydrolase/oxidoreductase [Atractiella rhizophila]